MNSTTIMTLKTTDLITSSIPKLGFSRQYNRSSSFSSVLTLKTPPTTTTTKLKSGFAAARGGGYIRSSSSPLESQLDGLFKSVSPSVITLQTLFDGPDNPENRRSSPLGAGVFVDPTLILTSARMVGRISTLHDLHKSFIGMTAAITMRRPSRLMKTTPLAVSFNCDLAVLKVVKPEDTLFPDYCPVSKFQPDEFMTMPITYRHEFGVLCMGGVVRPIGEKSVTRPKAPWPLDDELPWIAHDLFPYPGDSLPPPGTSAVTWTSGSPWFNFNGEIVGIASWEASTDEPDRRLLGFAVPPVCINAVLDYAKTKGPDDPIVMDRWMDSHVIPGVDDFEVRKEVSTSGDSDVTICFDICYDW